MPAPSLKEYDVRLRVRTLIAQIGELWLERVTPAAARHPTRLLLVHGMWGGSWYWANYQALLAEAGWESWALNLRGHHGSRPVADLGRFSVHDYVADVAKCVAHLGDTILIGHSMGGLVAQKAAERVRLRAAVFLTSAAPRGILVLRWPVLSRLLRYAGAMIMSRPVVVTPADADALLFNNLAPAARREAYARLVPESGRAARELALGLVAVDVGRVRCPTLVVGAVRDLITPAPVQRKIADKYGAEYREVPGHAHMLMLEDGWEAFGRELAAWLARAVA